MVIRCVSQLRQRSIHASSRESPRDNDCCHASMKPKFSELFMADLLSRNSRIEEDLIDQLFNSSEKRLARALLLLANFGKEGPGADCRKVQSGNPRGDDRYDPIAREPFHEQIPQIGLYRIQWKTGNS